MTRLDKAVEAGLEEQMERIVVCLEGYLKQGFEGGYWGFYISKPLGDLLNKNGISYTTYKSSDFEQSRVWYSKGEVSNERKQD